jgi:hypothetical protein
MSLVGASSETGIACNLDALSPSERTRRSELAEAVQANAVGVTELESGYRIVLPNDSSVGVQALELIFLERRCCPFLSLELSFEPADGNVHLGIGGPPGVKEFLRDNGVLGCAQPRTRSNCC